MPALLAAHGLGLVMLQLGFQRGSALATAGVATLFTNATPIAAGPALFREPLPAGDPGVLRVLAFVAVVIGAGLLTRASHGAEPRVEQAEPSTASRKQRPRLRIGSATRRVR